MRTSFFDVVRQTQFFVPLQKLLDYEVESDEEWEEEEPGESLSHSEGVSKAVPGGRLEGQGKPLWQGNLTERLGGFCLLYGPGELCLGNILDATQSTWGIREV